MDIATIYFSDGKSIEVKDGQLFMSIKSINNEKEKLNYASQSNVFKLWSHTDNGLTPSILELLFNSEYFFEIDIPSVIYNSKSVTRIENN